MPQMPHKEKYNAGKSRVSLKKHTSGCLGCSAASGSMDTMECVNLLPISISQLLGHANWLCLRRTSAIEPNYKQCAMAKQVVQLINLVQLTEFRINYCLVMMT